jgi:hypothetical protein
LIVNDLIHFELPVDTHTCTEDTTKSAIFSKKQMPDDSSGICIKFGSVCMQTDEWKIVSIVTQRLFQLSQRFS